MSNLQEAYYDATIGGQIEVKDSDKRNQRLVLSDVDSTQICNVTEQQNQPKQQQQQQHEDGSDNCESGDSGEGLSTIPIYSLDTREYNANQNKSKRECSPKTNDDGGRKRAKFLPQDVTLLEDLFIESQYPSTEVREKLEQQLGVCENRILVWFQNRRAKEKRETKKLHRIRNIRKQIDSKLQPPSFWPEDLSFNSPLRHITPSERRARTEVTTPTTPISEVAEDPINFMPHSIQPRVPVLSAHPFTESNPACSYHNSTYMLPITNEMQYTPREFPVTTIKSITLTQTLQPYATNQSEPIQIESAQWDQPIYPNTINYPCSIGNYLPIQTQFQGQSYPWFSSNPTLVPNQITPANVTIEDQYVPSNCNNIAHLKPCKQNY
ncbi:Homeodomain (HD) containing transcription factor [Oopsacas minuta]|uniref:Homeodomain (HD) containing transcription factor n=1 Tax=Oopsacas minuta TaxID=111878 RepID=A0AAV7K4Z5_9METZ|nr:Homeodomain (HD) containing transcription factor [Oopsacas minuta]